MDQVKIGKFIAQRRKLKNLTQSQLAESLSVSDRAVSKWENGKSMPDTGIMLDLCKILEINVNELLSGEKFMANDYNENYEKNLLKLAKEKEQTHKFLLRFEIVLLVVSLAFFLGACMIALFVPMQEWLQLVVVLSTLGLFLIPTFACIKIEQVAGYYECQHCKHKYVPTFKSVLFSMHAGRTRFMKCPKCEKWSWQKKVISKD